MNSQYLLLKENSGKLNGLFEPVFYRLKEAADRENFNSLLETGHLFLSDEIYGQLRELLKGRNPSVRLTEEDFASKIDLHLNGIELAEYGVWVYYPWSGRLVHILDEAEFIELRTSRNQYKITIEERELLAAKRVGVIGLSVGQSVALTMAMERSFGEIRLADFDILELTNLNRIRSGLHNLGLRKVVMVAREIAEIDPFLKISIFPEGLTEENMDAFFTEGGKLDVLIDECDGVDIKIMCRLKAKSLGIPVLMEASDRTTIDVERFDLEPDRSILHGFIDHLDVSKLKFLKTNEERMPYLAPMVGIDTMSVRLKASAIEVGQSITTWPQLASAVALGGGAVADIWRRIALDTYHESGRYFVDMEEIAGDRKSEPHFDPDEHIPVRALTDVQSLQTTVDLAMPALDGSEKLPAEVIRIIVSAAAHAPSGGNSQPWKWVYRDGILSLLHDRYFSYSFMDFRDSASYIALGAAIENVVLKTQQLGYEIAVHYNTGGKEERLIASFVFYNKGAKGENIEPVTDPGTASFIESRHTNRKVTPRVAMPVDIASEILNAGKSIPGAEITFFEKQADLDALGDIVSITDKYRLIYPQSHNDFTYQEMRWTDAEADARRTGMEISTLELQPSELVGLRLIRDPKVVAFLRHIQGGNIFRKVSQKAMGSASLAGFLTMPSFDRVHFLNGGRALQRMWLKAAQHNIAFHMMNVPLAYFARLQHDNTELPQEIMHELSQQYERFQEIVGHTEQKAEISLFRLFVADAPDFVPKLKLLDDILIIV